MSIPLNVMNWLLIYKGISHRICDDKRYPNAGNSELR